MNTSRTILSFVCVAVVAWAAEFAWSQTAAPAGAAATAPKAVPTRIQSVLACPLVDKAPTLDGKLDDAAWGKSQPLRQWSFRGRGINYQTEAWLCRDAEYFYIGARCFDDNLGELVTKNEGGNLWRNDCLEIYIVPEKKAKYFSHLIVDCMGKSTGGVWGPDKWNEPVEAKSIAMKVKTGREANAWTAEIAIPVKAFGLAITEKSIWAFGLNREKHSYPEEISSFQGGFNKPEEYPDLVFDGRTLVFDGVGGVKNVGAAKARFTLSSEPSSSRIVFGLEASGDLAPGESVSVPSTGELEPNEAISFTLDRGGPYATSYTTSASTRENRAPRVGPALGTEVYRMVEPAKAMAKIDTKALPEAKFKPGPMDDPKFFPVAVWAQPAGAAWLKSLKDIGVNVYYGGVDSYPSPKDKAYLDALQAAGAYAILPFKAQYVDQELYKHPAAIGWMHGDEPDQPKEGGATATAEELMGAYLKMRAPQPSLPVFMNLGQGVAIDRYGARVAYEKYPDYCKAADVVTYDVYPCNSLGADGPERLCVVAKGVERLVKWTEGKKPIWFVVEVNRFTQEGEKDSRAPTPEEVKTQVWMAITYGARGICLFCHSWHKTFAVSRIDPEMMKGLKDTFAEVHSLAEVISSPVLDAGASATAKGASEGGMIGLLTKKHGGATYVFAVNMFKKAEKPTIAVPGIADGSAEVLFENRTVPVKGGVLVDDFAPYAVHRYKIGGK